MSWVAGNSEAEDPFQYLAQRRSRRGNEADHLKLLGPPPHVVGYDWEEEMVKLHRHALANVAME
jgi:hypothetical protein